MQHAFFITGTDTGVGKSWSTASLMHYFKNQGKTVKAMKPIASGCETISGNLRNEDALLLQQYCSEPTAYDDINSFAFEPPVSPHIAAQLQGQQITFEPILSLFEKLKPSADIILIEGVGGWCVPLNDQQNIADLALALQLPVIMVVAIRLGCINHACLTEQAMLASGVDYVGWIGSHTEPDMLCRDENIKTLERLLSRPNLGLLPYLKEPDFDRFGKQLDLSALDC